MCSTAELRAALFRPASSAPRIIILARISLPTRGKRFLWSSAASVIQFDSHRPARVHINRLPRPLVSGQPFHIVLVRPEIPQNTGSIARLAAATRSRLHLVGPLGFSLEDRYLKRAGLDYWPLLDVRVYQDWEQFALL